MKTQICDLCTKEYEVYNLKLDEGMQFNYHGPIVVCDNCENIHVAELDALYTRIAIASQSKAS